jgi:hypothetical protein
MSGTAQFCYPALILPLQRNGGEYGANRANSGDKNIFADIKGVHNKRYPRNIENKRWKSTLEFYASCKRIDTNHARCGDEIEPGKGKCISTSINSYLKLSNEGTWADVQQAINAVGPLLHKFQTTVVEASIAMIKMGLFSQADELIEKLQQQASMYNELSKIPAPKTQKQRQSLQRLSSALDKLRKEVSSVEAKLNKAGATLKVS